MDHLSLCDHSRWLDDVRRILDVIETSPRPGLPLPSNISPDRVTFRFTATPRPEDTRVLLNRAREILEDRLAVVFSPEPRKTVTGSARHSTFTALLPPSWLEICLVTWTQHVEGDAKPASGNLRVLTKAA
jgi:hypothetical protein